MIGVIVVGPVADHDVRVPLPDQLRNDAPVLECGQDLPVVYVHHFGRNAQPPAHLHHLFLSTLRQRPSRRLPVTDIAIGRRNQLDVVPHFCPLHGHTRAAVLRIVGVRAKDDNPQLAVNRRLRGRGRFGQGDPRAPLVHRGPQHDSQTASHHQGPSRKSHSPFHVDLLCHAIFMPTEH